MIDLQNPGPGVYENVPAEVYHKIDACSNSRLTDIQDGSAALCKHKIDHPEAPTPAMLFGDACHFRILQPQLFPKHYAVAEQCAATKGDSSRCKNPGTISRTIGDETCWYCGVKGHDPQVGSTESRRVLLPDEFEASEAMLKSVALHPAAKGLLDARDGTELTILWNDTETGILCKSRIDVPVQKFKTICDVKTSISARHEDFQKSIFNFGYHRQAAMYHDAVANTIGKFEHFTFIVVEKTPPYPVAVYRLRDDVVFAGYQQLRPLMKQYAECRATGRWPGYSNDVQDIAVPPWAWKQMGLQEGVTV